jgi:hypothetical protein
MRFKFHGLNHGDFDKWVEPRSRPAKSALNRAAYLQLEKPSEREPVRHYAAVEPGLYDAILNRCVDSQQDVHEPDDGHRRRRRHGQARRFNVPPAGSRHSRPGTSSAVVAALCTSPTTRAACRAGAATVRARARP